MLKRIAHDYADENLTGFASNVTGAGPWTMTTTACTDGLAHQVSVRNDSATNHSAKTITLTGTDANGRAQTETINAPGSSATVESTKYFKTLASATVSATIGADTFDFGWVDEAVSETVALNWERDVPSNWLLDITGTINTDVQFTACDINDPVTYADQEALMWVLPNASLQGETADGTAAVQIPSGYTGARVRTNSYTSGAKLRLCVTQATAS